MFGGFRIIINSINQIRTGKMMSWMRCGLRAEGEGIDVGQFRRPV